MSTITVPRTFGGTLVLTLAPPPVSAIPTTYVIATFRRGDVQATYRDGEQQALHRSGTTQEGGR